MTANERAGIITSSSPVTSAITTTAITTCTITSSIAPIPSGRSFAPFLLLIFINGSDKLLAVCVVPEGARPVVGQTTLYVPQFLVNIYLVNHELEEGQLQVLEAQLSEALQNPRDPQIVVARRVEVPVPVLVVLAPLEFTCERYV